MLSNTYEKINSRTNFKDNCTMTGNNGKIHIQILEIIMKIIKLPLPLNLSFEKYA